MTWRRLIGFGVVTLALAPLGCSDREPTKPLFPPLETGARAPGAEVAATTIGGDDRGVVIQSVVQMLRRAATDPAGDIFTNASERLNQYFGTEEPAAFEFSPGEREYLGSRLPPEYIATLAGREFDRQRDGRHIQDCMLYRALADRLAGDGDDLTRVRRVFDWTVRHVQLAPAGYLAPPNLPQAMARPHDVLLRGAATEAGGFWSERSWLFVALCRQLGVDVGLLTYNRPGSDEPVYWACAALVDGKPYLFDARIGLPIPGPEGRPVATLEEVIADPSLLTSLDLPGQSPYTTLAADLGAGPITVWIDSTPGYLSPRMRALEKELTGRDRVNLFRDPSEQQAAFAAALGKRLGGVELWQMPAEVFARLFGDPRFVAATQYPMQVFDAKLPLLSARMAHLRGELKDAVQAYVNLRFAENPAMTDDRGKPVPIPPQVQHFLDMNATYFLGLAQLELGRDTQADFFFKETIRMIPEPEPGKPLFPFSIFPWGAATNLAHLAESRGDTSAAVLRFCTDTRTPQNQGNRLRARALVWQSPFASDAVPKPEGTAAR